MNLGKKHIVFAASHSIAIAPLMPLAISHSLAVYRQDSGTGVCPFIGERPCINSPLCMESLLAQFEIGTVAKRTIMATLSVIDKSHHHH